ncbi:MAG: thiamine-phosphate kinase [Deltaproteobacteria bacterium CG11_big_fil_rev_8_21_14_0_20_42_23]|nr:MAG: thiamine-phosphate kinase [Deltaproteobacteria bacterium CG11_big_fil_rev_8_21_14_0_20_42_23]PJC64008.1 MAG: thiamine-phosphate kinase [Deltaproteobacteria bacterium CG_4_9_14_0_2_um_filter_42_21]
MPSSSFHHEESFYTYLRKVFSSHRHQREAGIGDDCAVLPLDKTSSLLVSTDQLIENIHFKLKFISAQELGKKSMLVNISDISAMGGNPCCAFVSLGLPKSISKKWIKDFYKGLKKISDAAEIKVLGGDTSTSPKHVFINITIMGKIKTAKIKYRNGAKANDFLYVTSTLGDSALGLQLLLKQKTFSAVEKKLVSSHLSPRLFLREGQWLATQKEVHAMMDISDGLDLDLRRMLSASSVGARVELEDIPLSAAFQTLVQRKKLPPYPLALCGGEDYALLFSVDGKKSKSFEAKYASAFGHKPFCIGMCQKGKKLEYSQKGKPFTLKSSGFDHFKP